MDINILDCTLRDGGYYTNWDFSKSLIEEYLDSMAAVGIEYVELGFRTIGSNSFSGVCAHTTDKFLARIAVPDSVRIAVMVNASDLIAYDGDVEEAIKLMFSNEEQSVVKLVRLACHFEEVERILPAVIELKRLGYMVGVNLMQITQRSSSEIGDLVVRLDEYDFDVIYSSEERLKPPSSDGQIYLRYCRKQ